MTARYLKIAASAAVGAMALLYALQNIVNLDAAYASVGAVLRMEGHDAYPNAIGPAVGLPALIWLAVLMIVVAELAAAVFAGKGAWDLWRARRAAPADFTAAKRFALLGCGAAFLVWFGFFIVIGGAYFQMWQTEIGRGSLEGAFQIAGCAGLALIFVHMPEA